MLKRTTTKAPRYRSLFAAVAAGFLLCLTLLGGGAAALCRIDLPPAALPVWSTLALCCGCATAGWLAGRWLRRHGIRRGLLCGLAVCCAVRLTAMLLLGRWDCLPALSQLLCALGSGALGGILGVNTKNRYLSR